MSNSNNDQLYDRASDLIGYINTQEALDLNGSLEDLDALYEMIKRLEDKYLGSVKTDVTATVRASQSHIGSDLQAVHERRRAKERQEPGYFGDEDYEASRDYGN